MNYSSSSEAVSWFKDHYRNEALILKPPFQRKPVWGSRQKCYLIESILLGFPVPEIYIQRSTSATGETTYAIVDGQQRIRTLLQFVGIDREPGEEGFNGFVLDKLDSDSRWINRSFEDLSPAERIGFFDYQLAVRYLNTGSDDDVREVFRRLNRFLSPLKPQELRNATYFGPFLQLSTRLADDEYWVDSRILSAAAIRRMGDIEFMSELLICVMHGPQGGSRDTIDAYYQQLEDYDEFPEQREAQRLFGQALSVIKVVLPDVRDTRWSNKTDFYTLFGVIAALLREKRIRTAKVAGLRKRLDTFAKRVDRFLANRAVKVPARVREYVLAAEKGANDRMRRAQRHNALLPEVEPYFKVRS